MPPQFTFNAHVLSIIDSRRLCVRISKEHIEKISSILSVASDRNVIKDTVVVNVSDSTFAITQIEWSDLSDLIGVEIKITAFARKYNYWRTKETTDGEDGRRFVNLKYKGASIIAQRISNVV